MFAMFVAFYPPSSGHSDFGAVGALPAPAGALSNGSGSSLSNLGSSFGSTGGNGSSSSRSSSVGSSGLTPSGQGNGGAAAAAAAAAGGGPVNGLGLCKLFSTICRPRRSMFRNGWTMPVELVTSKLRQCDNVNLKYASI